MKTVKLFGHSTGFDPCPGARKWVKTRVEMRTVKYPISGAVKEWLRAECPTCGKWLSFDTKGKEK